MTGQDKSDRTGQPAFQPSPASLPAPPPVKLLSVIHRAGMVCRQTDSVTANKPSGWIMRRAQDVQFRLALSVLYAHRGMCGYWHELMCRGGPNSAGVSDVLAPGGSTPWPE